MTIFSRYARDPYVRCSDDGPVDSVATTVGCTTASAP